ncbi:MAG: GNAT family N-acetyltransferase [Acidimicrobiia bacterium]|nr:GNAT family N-acetyltransferase [Acidimicrobiia bacterium]MDH5292112.1 GNAT family N-acetyltransferase [Acidimicrobiia bacterium]
MGWLQDPLETSRLVLRAPTESDLDVIVRMLTDPTVRGYLGGPVPEDRARATLAGPPGEKWGSFLVTRATDAAVVGSCLVDAADGELDISYQLLPEFWGHGYAREAVLAVLDWIWHETDAGHVVAVTRADNAASVKLLQVVGMSMESEFEDHGAWFIRFHLDRP